MPTGAAGTTLTLDAIYQDGTGTATEPTTPLVDIINPLGVTVVNNAVPTAPGQTGRREYVFAIPLAGPLGAWTARWTGIINGANVQADEVFQVVAAGEVIFPSDTLLAPESPCAPWCAVPDPSESGFNMAQDAPAWCCNKIDLTDPDARAKAIWASGAVSSLLFRLSGLRFNGGCTTEQYLCLRESDGCWRLGWGDDWRSLPSPSGDGATWLNHRCGRAGCDCGSGRRIRLPFGPVVAVESVTIGDALIPEANYRVVGDSIYLCDDAADADVCFDACTGSGLLVAWTWGQAPPPEGIIAACAWTCEMFKSCNGEPCAIPSKAQLRTRPGMSFRELTPADFLKDGFTGIDEVDYFLAAWGHEPPATVTFPEDVSPIDFGSRARDRW